MTTTNATMAPYQVIDEPLLSFDAVDRSQRALNAQSGLARFGPFSARSWSAESLGVRVAMLAPEADLQRLKDLLNEIHSPQLPRERRPYLPRYPGFPGAFRCAIKPAPESAQLALDPDLDRRLRRSSEPHRELTEAFAHSLRQLRTVRSQFGVIVIYLPRRWSDAFVVGDFDLHDTIKADAAQLGLPTQIVTDDAIGYNCRASVAWRLGQALYAKAGGVPYKLVTDTGYLDADAAFVGLAYATRTRDDGNPAFTVCASQIFDSAGGGMDFVAFDVSGDVDPQNPLLNREQMRGVISASLGVYADRASGHRPSRLVVHKRLGFTGEEVAGCADAWGDIDGLECLSLSRSPWFGLELTPGPPNRWSYATRRGTVLSLDEYSRLIWVAGNAPAATLSGKDNYFQAGKGIPRPLLMTRWAGTGDLTQAAAEVLALTKIDWNNDALYGALPVTIKYAQVLAGVVKHVPTLPEIPFDYRLFM
ncbi:MAG: nuclease PIN [Chloroflexi bacterium]|nr:nuclease PIN [Chloroflexota bacterium]MCY3695903.1 nuclease PIN [Chloroflexota bacterium]